MPGILDYRRYLQTLQAVTDIGNTFPSTQQKFTFTVEGGATASWTASVDAKTLIVDQVSYNRFDNRPDFSNSQVIGYFEGITTGSQTTTGVIYLPGGVYAGPILPGGNVYVPVTIYNITWTDGTETFSHQLGFVQNWEPGVEIGNPADSFDFEPIDPLPSTLTLTNSSGLDRIIFEDTLFLIAETDIPIELGTQNAVKFFKIVDGEEVLLGQSFFVGQRALFVIDSDPNLPIGEYQFVAKNGGRRQYGRQTSNVLDIDVLEGIPLLVQRSEFVPDKEYYFPGDSVEHTLEVYPDPAFTATGFAVTSTTTVRLIDGFPPNTSYLVEEDHFDNGVNTSTFVTSATMVDTAINYLNTFTNFSYISSSTSPTQFTATILVWNTETVRTNWGSQPEAKYGRGSFNDFIQVANTTTITVTATAFPIVIIQDKDNTIFDESFDVTVSTPNVNYYNSLTIFAVSGTTVLSLVDFNNSPDGVFTATISNLNTTGTWSLFASYPGDTGLSLFNANLASTSNTLTHRVRSGNELFPTPVFTYWNSGTSTYLNLWATTSTTLTNEVSFYEGDTLLGTANWQRLTITTATTVTTLITEGGQALVGSFDRNFDAFRLQYDANDDILLDLGPRLGPISSTGNSQQDQLYIKNTFYGSNASFPTSVNVNSSRCFKFYDGTNYNLSLVTGTNVNAIADPISTGTWNVVYAGRRSGGLEFQRDHGLASGASGGWPRINTAGPDNFVDMYDIYKIDTIGDSRGYNVIGLDATGFTGDPLLSESNPLRLYFRAPSMAIPRGVRPGQRGTSYTPTKTRYIDLVEYIGETSWQKPFENEAQAAGTEPRSTITVKLFRFTPTIPQANFPGYSTQFRNEDNWFEGAALLPDPDDRTEPGRGPEVYNWSTQLSFYEFQRSALGINITRRATNEELKILFQENYDSVYPSPPWYTSEPLTYYSANGAVKPNDFKQLGVPNSTRSAVVSYGKYGVKIWTSRNTNDPVENDLADFYNEWFATFVGGTRGGGRVRDGILNDPYLEFRAEYSTSTTFITTEYNTQTATLVLPQGTISTVTNLRAVWTGTQFLPLEFGKFLPVEVSISNPAKFDITLTDKTNSGYKLESGGLIFNETSSTVLWDTNPGFVNIEMYTDPYQYPIALTTGSLVLVNNGTGATITTSTISTSTRLQLYATDIAGAGPGGFIPVRFAFTNTEFTMPSLKTENIQVSKGNYSWQNFVTVAPFITIDGFGGGGQQEVGSFLVATFNKNDFGNPSSGIGQLSGGIDLLLPFFNRGLYPEPRNPTGISPLLWIANYLDGYTNRYRETSTFFIQLSYQYDNGDIITRFEKSLTKSSNGPVGSYAIRAEVNNFQTLDASLWTTLKWYVNIQGNSVFAQDLLNQGFNNKLGGARTFIAIPVGSRLGYKNSIVLNF
jgi:hypothetical protein